MFFLSDILTKYIELYENILSFLKYIELILSSLAKIQAAEVKYLRAVKGCTRADRIRN
jgi:hypothetical protein